MTDTKTIGGLQTLEILNLESLLEDECKCESKHTLSECSIEVVGIKFLGCEGVRFLICQNSYNWNMEAISDKMCICDECKRDCADCWRIVPI